MTDYFHLNAAPDTVRAISSLGLAHLGDGVFELMVRSWLCLHGKATSKGLHRATVRYVAAPAQARAVERRIDETVAHRLITAEEYARAEALTGGRGSGAIAAEMGLPKWVVSAYRRTLRRVR